MTVYSPKVKLQILSNILDGWTVEHIPEHKPADVRPWKPSAPKPATMPASRAHLVLRPVVDTTIVGRIARKYRKLLLHLARGNEDHVQEALAYLVGHPVDDEERALGLACLRIKHIRGMDYRHDNVVTHGLALVAVETERRDTTAKRIALYKGISEICPKYQEVLMAYLNGKTVKKDILYRAKNSLRTVVLA